MRDWGWAGDPEWQYGENNRPGMQMEPVSMGGPGGGGQDPITERRWAAGVPLEEEWKTKGGRQEEDKLPWQGRWNETTRWRETPQTMVVYKKVIAQQGAEVRTSFSNPSMAQEAQVTGQWGTPQSEHNREKQLEGMLADLFTNQQKMLKKTRVRYEQQEKRTSMKGKSTETTGEWGTLEKGKAAYPQTSWEHKETHKTYEDEERRAAPKSANNIYIRETATSRPE